jgi:hypothetical protein
MSGPGWGNPVVGGTTLRIPAIQSPNFSIANQTGWAIFANGTAWFFDVNVVGVITGGTLVIDGTSGGVFVYSGVPALGNLIGSWAGSAGIDAEGNSYLANFASYGPNGSYININTDGTEIAILFNPPSVTHQTAGPEVFAFAQNAGLVNESNLFVITSGKNGGDDAALQLFAEAANASAQARAVFEFGGTIFCTINKTGLILPGGATPAAISGSAEIFATTDGAFAVVDGIDQEPYATERRSIISPGGNTISVAAATIFAQSNVAALTTARSYRINAAYPITANQAAGTILIGWGSTPAGSAGLLHIYTTEGTSIWDVGWKSMGTLGSLGFTMTNGTVYSLHVEGVVTIPAGESGVFSLQGACGTAGDSFTIDANGFLDMLPV